MSEEKNIAAFQIAQRHAAAVTKFREGIINRFELHSELISIRINAETLRVPYVIPTNFIDLINEESQYEYGYEESYQDSYEEPESSEYC